MPVQRIDIARQCQRHNVGLEPVDHRACLLARTAMGLLDRYILAGSCLPVPDEGLVEFGVKLAGRVVRHVKQCRLLSERRQGRHGKMPGNGGGRKNLDKVASVFHGFFACSSIDRPILVGTARNPND
jgi:hypothetical protein